MNGVHVICPCCGTEIEIGDNTTTVKGNGQLPDGIYTLIPKNDQKLQALATLGFDTSKFFSGFGTGSSSSGFSGSSASADRPEDYDDCTPDPQIDEDEDDIQQEIMSDGYIEGKNLFRRWVMAQMFRALQSGDYQKYYKENYNYLYQWQVIVNEFKAQCHISMENESSIEELRTRQKFFNRQVLYDMLQDYRKKLLSFIKKSKKFGEKDNQYIFVPYNANYYLSEMPKTLTEIDTLLKQIENTGKEHFVYFPDIQDPTPLRNYASEIYRLIKGFNNRWPRLKNNTPKTPAFREAFMAAGAYYTLENMIKFHGCYIYPNEFINKYLNTSYVTDEMLSQDLSLEILDRFKNKYNCYVDDNAYNLFKLMLDTIEKNKFQKDW